VQLVQNITATLSYLPNYLNLSHISSDGTIFEKVSGIV